MDKKAQIKKRWLMINRLFTLFVVVVVSFTILREVHIFFSSNLHYEEQLLDYRRAELKQEVSNRIDEISSIETALEADFLKELKHHVTIVDHFASEAVNHLDPGATLEEKREAYIESVYQYDLSDDAYLFFSFDDQGMSWLLGLDKSDEHTSIYDLVDPVTGELFVVNMIDAVMENQTDGAYISYYWPKNIGGEPIEKTSYLNYNSEVELIIGTGMYYDDALQEVKDEFFSRIDSYYQDSEEYVYIFGFDGTVYVHGNDNYTTEMVLDLKTASDEPAHQYIVDQLVNNESIELSYLGPDENLGIVEKHGYVQRIEGWDMYIGQSLYNGDVALVTKSYMQQSLFGLIVSVASMAVISFGLIYILKTIIRRNFADVQSEFKKQSDVIADMALKDFLTGLHNRSFFDLAFQEFISSGISGYSLIQGDANGLKLTNDAFGHDEGDRLLVAISELLHEVFDGDEIFRWGGDEFLILSRIQDKEEIKEKLKTFQAEASKDNTKKVNISVSFGYVLCDITADPYEEMKKAEKMMYDRKTFESTSTKRKIIDKILESLYASDNFEEQHSNNVMMNALLIGEELSLGGEELSKLRLGALMHDIGKIGIPDNILSKPGKLTDDEFDEVKKHSEKGFRILSAYPQLSEYGYIVLHHHEKYDGTGYPMKLVGEEIPFHSRIITVADAFDAMVEERVYKDTMTEEEALLELIRCKNTQFDPKIVDAFVQAKEALKNN